MKPLGDSLKERVSSDIEHNILYDVEFDSLRTKLGT